MKELKIIFKFFLYSLQTSLTNIPMFLFFMLTKVIRYTMFAVFLVFLVSGISSLGGYNKEQMLIFYLIFNLVDTSSQLLFREVYRFRALVVNGGFDMVLIKPVNPLVRSLFGGPDFIDAGMLVLLMAVIAYILPTLHPSLESVFIFIALVINSLLISTAFHTLVLGIGILTLSIDHLIMIYRDLTSLVRIPVDIFTQPLRSFITFVIPLGIMFTFPAKVLLGLLSWQLVLISFVFGIGGLFLSICFWNYALTKYQSASS